MILELFATCIIAGGMVYIPPDGWTLDKVVFAGQQENCTFYNLPTIPHHALQQGSCTGLPGGVRYAENKVIVRRIMKPGETVEPPPGCALVTAIKDSKDEKEQ